jgi:hypothetical protein
VVTNTNINLFSLWIWLKYGSHDVKQHSMSHTIPFIKGLMSHIYGIRGDNRNQIPTRLNLLVYSAIRWNSIVLTRLHTFFSVMSLNHQLREWILEFKKNRSQFLCCGEQLTSASCKKRIKYTTTQLVIRARHKWLPGV